MSTTPPAPAPPPFDIKTDLALLNTLHTRNKNQHRSSKWYKWFLILRRNLRKLVAGDQLEARKKFVRRVIVPRCYVAFSTVIANNRYVSLGLVLMGILAVVNRFVGGGPEEEVVKKGKAVVGKEVEVVRKWDEYAVSLEDFGEVVMRDSMEANVGVAVRGVEAEAAVQDYDASSSAVNGDTTTAKSEEAITISTTGSERTTTLTTQVEKPSKKKRKSVIEDPSSPPEESLPLLTQPRSVPASVPPSRSISPKPKLKRSKKGDPNSRRKKKKRGDRDEIDDLFAGPQPEVVK